MSGHPRKLAILRTRASDRLNLTSATAIQGLARAETYFHNSFPVILIYASTPPSEYGSLFPVESTTNGNRPARCRCSRWFG